MTIAICTECGARKFGAFSRCDHCGFTPTSSTDRARSILLSDHHYTPDELNRLGEAIKSGKSIQSDPASLTTYARTLDCLEADPEALQCAVCGEDLDSFDETLCQSCRASKDTTV